ncbi:hypothetical protein GGR52DRAFT_279927 [Hypoxylon sp. FL1284]|nr:hypothetical protein GGR52DRAFT_279927 [Hypoxylon sp. FL1284]
MLGLTRICRWAYLARVHGTIQGSAANQLARDGNRRQLHEVTCQLRNDHGGSFSIRLAGKFCCIFSFAYLRSKPYDRDRTIHAEECCKTARILANHNCRWQRSVTWRVQVRTGPPRRIPELPAQVWPASLPACTSNRDKECIGGPGPTGRGLALKDISPPARSLPDCRVNSISPSHIFSSSSHTNPPIPHFGEALAMRASSHRLSIFKHVTPCGRAILDPFPPRPSSLLADRERRI